jgi:hypothetical protein
MLHLLLILIKAKTGHNVHKVSQRHTAVRFVDKVALELDFPQVIWFSSVSIT